LFETLRGAGNALTESSNVEALRNGLSGPMRGLTRSFGCSAAGVSASAMLGLAAVLVRRIEARTLAAVHVYAGGPLRELSPVRRQLEALDRLASQGEALPVAASALAQAASQLGTLTERWDAAHRSATAAQQKSLSEAFERMRGELARTAIESGKQLTESIAPVLKQVVAQTGEAASRQMSATLEALERDLATRRTVDAQLRSGMRDELAAMRAWLEQDARLKGEEAQQRGDAFEQSMKLHAEQQAALLSLHRDQASAHVGGIESAARALTVQLSEDAEARREESQRLLGDLAARVDDAARERAQESRDELQAVASLGHTLLEQAREREASLTARWETMTQRAAEASELVRVGESERIAGLRGELERQNAALAQSWAQLAERVEQHTLALRNEEEARLTRLDSLAGRLGGDFARLTSAMSEQLDARLERERAEGERGTQAMLQLEQSGKALEDSLARQELAVQALLDGGAALFTQLGERAQDGSREALEKLIEVSDLQAARFTQLETQLQASQVAHAKSLADELSAQADRLGKGLEGTTQLVNEAASVLKASSFEMGAVAELFAKSVDRQRDAAQAWLESLGELEGAVERAGRGAAADALGDQLASTHEVFARQLQFQRELFEQLRSLRIAPPQPARGEHDVSA
jgi:hypothetical protein